MVEVEAGCEQHLFFAEGECEGINSYFPEFRTAIETRDGDTILFESQGYGRAYPERRRQIVGSVRHLSDSGCYRRLNDTVCVCVGEVRASEAPAAPIPMLVLDVAELIWEPIAD